MSPNSGDNGERGRKRERPLNHAFQDLKKLGKRCLGREHSIPEPFRIRGNRESGNKQPKALSRRLKIEQQTTFLRGVLIKAEGKRDIPAEVRKHLEDRTKRAVSRTGDLP